MDHPFKLTLAVAALLVGSAVPSAGQQFEYTPYKGFNNTGQPSDPPTDNYTPTHPGGPAPEVAPSNAAAPAYNGGGSDAYSGGNSAARSPGGGYSTPRGAYSPSEDVFSPARSGRGTPPPPVPPRGVGGPPPEDLGGDLPRIEVQAAAPDDGVPYSVRKRDAHRAAIQGWRSKVADRYGPEFSHWRIAVGKRVDCHPDRRDGIICTASAQPVRGFDHDNSWAPVRR